MCECGGQSLVSGCWRVGEVCVRVGAESRECVVEDRKSMGEGRGESLERGRINTTVQSVSTAE